jgi:hypothetical protein
MPGSASPEPSFWAQKSPPICSAIWKPGAIVMPANDRNVEFCA